MKIFIVLTIFAMVGTMPLKAGARSTGEGAPRGELINYPACGSAQDAFTLLLCDDFEG